MRRIDADAIVSRIKPLVEAERQIFKKESWNFAKKCLAVVESSPTVSAEPEWIPCGAKYPKENGYYLVTIRGYIDDGLEVAVEYYSPYNSKYLKKWKAMNVIAWAVPKPYKGE